MAVLFLLCAGMFIGNREECKAATSYSNAMEFYNSVSKPRKGEVYQGDFYIGTMAKLASSSSNLKYQTLGYDIVVSGNGASVQFSVAVGGSIQHLTYATVESGGYQYNLYCIPTYTIKTLASAVNSYAAAQVFSGSSIDIYAYAIVTTKQYGSVHGSVYENGAGGLYESNAYHLLNPTHLSIMQGTFAGHTFDNYRRINGTIDNHQLSILYDIGSGASVTNGYSASEFSAEHNSIWICRK